MICEMMGRDAGHIALHSGIAGGADVILIPEIPYTLDAVAAKLKQVHEEEGRRHALGWWRKASPWRTATPPP
jgi:6-phosphofructokinase 1